jgi:hypothetical protein
MLKRTVVRLLLFGIPFGLSYWIAMPTPQIAGEQTVVVCTYPGDRPGELRINLSRGACQGPNPVEIIPAGRSLLDGAGAEVHSGSINVPF